MHLLYKLRTFFSTQNLRVFHHFGKLYSPQEHHLYHPSPQENTSVLSHQSTPVVVTYKYIIEIGDSHHTFRIKHY
jgi:hypothetical protein